MGIDFSGGTSVQLNFNQPVSIEKARIALAHNNVKEANLQEIKDTNKLTHQGWQDHLGVGDCRGNRTVITSLTTFMAAISLLLFGGEVIHDFAFALVIGIVVGTCSSIFIASPIALELESRKSELASK